MPLRTLRTRSLAFVLVTCSLVACTGSDPVPASAPANDGGVGSGTNAVACTPGGACAAGTCVDGFCCDAPCTGLCEACNLPGQEGHCAPVSGAPHHGKCDGDATGVCAGSCDGTSTAACTYPEAPCGAASCAANAATLPSTCKGGTCPATTTQACAAGCFGDTCLGVKQLAAGYSFACAVMTDTKVRCWGDNSSGQIGQGGGGSDPSYKTPQQVVNLTGVESVATTFGSVCALLADHTVWCWGSNSSGELGLGTVDSNVHSTPVQVPTISGATFLGGSSGGHYCAIVAGGALRCWGTNSMGELGNGMTAATAATPVTTCAPGSTTLPCTAASGVTFVAGGDDHTCAAFAGGQVACWGGNGFAQLGQVADNVAHPFPKEVPGLTATALTGGNRMSCAATAGGAKCWGANGGGRLGNGTNATSQVTPVSVCTAQDCSTLLTGVTGVSTYDVSVCAAAAGAVKCWGDNSGGQLGDGNSTPSQNFAGSTAVASGAVSVVSGGQTNYAIVVDRANRNVMCWGADGVGECGDNPSGSTTRKVPVTPAW